MKKSLLMISMMIALAIALGGCETKGDLQEVQAQEKAIGQKRKERELQLKRRKSRRKRRDSRRKGRDSQRKKQNKLKLLFRNQ